MCLTACHQDSMRRQILEKACIDCMLKVQPGAAILAEARGLPLGRSLQYWNKASDEYCSPHKLGPPCSSFPFLLIQQQCQVVQKIQMLESQMPLDSARLSLHSLAVALVTKETTYPLPPVDAIPTVLSPPSRHAPTPSRVSLAGA